MLWTYGAHSRVQARVLGTWARSIMWPVDAASVKSPEKEWSATGFSSCSLSPFSLFALRCLQICQIMSAIATARNAYHLKEPAGAELRYAFVRCNNFSDGTGLRN